MPKLCALHDTGAPEGSTDYTTLVILHGYVWHGGTFVKLLPLAHAHNTRIILINRRDYPGTIPYADEERASLLSCRDAPADDNQAADRREKLLEFLQHRAWEILEFLTHLVKDDHIPPAGNDKNAGGIIVVGWSFGVVWMLALLAYVSSFPEGEIDLSRYVRRVVAHDPGFFLFGYSSEGVPDPYSPLLDPSIPESDRDATFSRYIWGYFSHGDTLDTFERRRPLTNPPPTVLSLTDDQLATMKFTAASVAGQGADWLLFRGGKAVDLYSPLKKKALYPIDATWGNVEVRFLWCTQSVWEVPYAFGCLLAELEEAKTNKIALRDIRVLRVRGNHFVHWDAPELALRAFLDDVNEPIADLK